MVAQKGKDLLLKVHNGSAYDTVAGLRSKRLSFNAETVDVTDAESAGRWRELLGGAGVQRASVSGALLDWQLVIPGFGTVTGLFQVTALEYSGQHNGEVQFELALESAGQISFGAL